MVFHIPGLSSSHRMPCFRSKSDCSGEYTLAMSYLFYSLTM